MHAKEYIDVLKKQLKKVNIVILTHINPDGDAVSSCLAMYHYLTKLDNNVNVVLAGPVPEHLRWLPGVESILIASCVDTYSFIESTICNADFVFVLDLNESSRLGRPLLTLFKQLDRHKQKTIVIDHHIVMHNRLFRENFDYAFVNSKACSTALLVYEYIYLMDNANIITDDIATCIYTGMFTDTNNFTTSNVNSHVHRVLAELLDYGAQADIIASNLYTYTELKLKLLGECIKNKIYYDKDNNFAILSIAQQDILEYKIAPGDTDGIINYALLLKGVNIAILLTEGEKFVKLSIRSRNGASALKLAADHFGGGGHVNAAGAVCNLTLQGTFEKLVNILTLKT